MTDYCPTHPRTPIVRDECFRCRRAERAREAARRRREAPDVLGGVDVRAAFAALRRLPVFKEHKLPRSIRLDIGHMTSDACGGRSWARRSKTSGRIRIYGGASARPEGVLELVLHELCHLACPFGEKHGPRFRAVLARGAREAWGVRVAQDVPRDTHQNTAYAMDALIVAALALQVASGECDTFPPKAPTPKPSRAEQTTALVEKRASHAVVMLRKAETRLKRARSLHAKWKKKVGYYERQAAKGAK